MLLGRATPLAGGLTGDADKVVGEPWNASDSFAVEWMLSDLEALLLDDQPGTSPEILDRWAPFTATS